MDREKIKANIEFIDKMLDVFGGDEDSPIDFKIMKFRNDVIRTSEKIMLNEKFLRMNDDSELKKTVLKFFEEGSKILKELCNKINN